MKLSPIFKRTNLMKISLKKLAGKLLNKAFKAVEQQLAKRLRTRINAGISSVDDVDPKTSFEGANQTSPHEDRS
jgi:hypothetical protein